MSNARRKVPAVIVGVVTFITVNLAISGVLTLLNAVSGNDLDQGAVNSFRPLLLFVSGCAAVAAGRKVLSGPRSRSSDDAEPSQQSPRS